MLRKDGRTEGRTDVTQYIPPLFQSGGIIIKQNKTGRITGSCYSGDHTAEDHIHTDITTCNIEEPQQKNPIGTVSNRSVGAGGLKHVLLNPNPVRDRTGSVTTQERKNYNSKIIVLIINFE